MGDNYITDAIDPDLLTPADLTNLRAMGLLPKNTKVILFSKTIGEGLINRGSDPVICVNTIQSDFESGWMGADKLLFKDIRVFRSGLCEGIAIKSAEGLVNITPYCFDPTSINIKSRAAVDLLFIYGKKTFESVAGDLLGDGNFSQDMLKISSRPRLKSILWAVRPNPNKLRMFVKEVSKNRNLQEQPQVWSVAHAKEVLNFAMDHKRWPVTPNEALTGSTQKIRLDRFNTTFCLGRIQSFDDSVCGGTIYMGTTRYGSRFKLAISASRHITADSPSVWVTFMSGRVSPSNSTEIEGIVENVPDCVKTLGELALYAEAVNTCPSYITNLIAMTADATKDLTFQGLITMVKVFSTLPENKVVPGGTRFIDLKYDAPNNLILANISVKPLRDSTAKPSNVMRAVPLGLSEKQLLGALMSVGLMTPKQAIKLRNEMTNSGPAKTSRREVIRGDR